MRKARIFVRGVEAGTLVEIHRNSEYVFEYLDDYKGQGISCTMPSTVRVYKFNKFPSFFDGLLPEGIQLEGLLKIRKIDRNDCFSQLIAVGDDMIGVITAKEIFE